MWRRRFSNNEHDPRRFARGAYFNTTGVTVNGQVRQRPQIAGYARFNGRGSFDPNHPSRMVNRVFECAAPCVWLGNNKLLFKRMLSVPEKPDGFLVVVRPAITGILKVGAANWRSADSWLIAFSECRDQQEAMLLMPAHGRIRTERQVRTETGDWPPVGWAACAGLCKVGADQMRYWKGSIALSPTQDYPLLRQVLHSTFVTHRQLYELLKLDYHAHSRNAFNNRALRLVRNKYLVRNEIPYRTQGYVYSISDKGASELIGLGEYYTSPTCRPKDGQIPKAVFHPIELNEIHLALKRSQQLVRWMPDTEIRSRNELTDCGYREDYDAVVTVRIDGGERKFALEYERPPKARQQYLKICDDIAAERAVDSFLYLVPNYDLLSILVGCFATLRRPIYFGLVGDFLDKLFDMPLRNARPGAMTTLRNVLR